MKAIETEYRGYRFRSRLEARWAVFFDALDIEWQYEPQGFEVGEGEHVARYLPDFYLPAGKTWVEVKGTDEQLKEDWNRIARVLDWCSPMEGVYGSFEPYSTRGLLLLGDIPKHCFGYTFHPIIQHEKGLRRTWAVFTPTVRDTDPAPILTIPHRRDWIAHMVGVPTIESGLDSGPSDWTCRSVGVLTEKAMPDVIHAYAQARQARFEFGETPRVGKWAP